MHITQHSIKFKIDKPERYNSNMAYSLYAILCENISPEYAEKMHAQSEFRPICQNLSFDRRENIVEWNVTLFGEAQKEFAAALELEEYHIINRDVVLKPIQHSTAVYTTEYLLDKAKANADNSAKANMLFCTPTSFKQNGEYAVFPSVELILSSIAGMWSAYDETIKLNDPDVIGLMAKKIRISSYNLKSSYYRFKSVRIPAFTGRITLSAKLAPPLMEIYSLLLEFSNLSGAGIKNALGMGKIKTERIVYNERKQSFVQPGRNI